MPCPAQDSVDTKEKTQTDSYDLNTRTSSLSTVYNLGPDNPLLGVAALIP